MATREEQLSAAYQAKLAARRNGTTEVKTYPAAGGSGLISQISDIDARYRHKLVARVSATRNDRQEPAKTEKAVEAGSEKTAPKGEHGKR